MKNIKKFLCVLITAVILISSLSAAAFASSASDFVVENGVLTEYTGAGGKVVIPDDLGITAIGDEVFYNCDSFYKITSVTIPEGVTAIGSYAFYNCGNLESVTIPDSVTSVGTAAFAATGIPKPIFIGNNKTICYVPDSYASYEIPDTVTHIGAGAFFECDNLTAVKMPTGVTEIGDMAFEGCAGLTSISIPEGVISVGDYAFFFCSGLTAINIPNSVINVGTSAFSGTWISDPLFINDNKTLCYVPNTYISYEIPETVTQINGGAFSSCFDLTSVVIPEGVTAVGDYAFSGCGLLKTVFLPSGTTAIGRYAFASCYCLDTITIPNSTTNIGEYAFLFCYNLIICGEKGSFAEQYASTNGIEFVDISLLKTATPTASAVIVNNKEITFEAYNIDGHNYFKLCDLAKVLKGTAKQFEIDCGSDNSIVLTSGKSYTTHGNELEFWGNTENKTATPTAPVIYLNGTEISMTAYRIDGYNYFKLRDVASAIDFGVTYDPETKAIGIDTTTG